MKKHIEITYTTDSPVPKYAKEIRAVKTKEALVEVLEFYLPITKEALSIALSFNDQDFKDFQKDIKRAERETKDEEWIKIFVSRFGEIAAPSLFMIIELMCSQFHAPWGTCFIRYQEINKQKK